MSENKPKRILHIVGGMERAGTETMLMNLYRKIDHDKIQFDFISYSESESHYDDEIRRLGGVIIKLNNSYSPFQIYKAIKQFGPYNAVHIHTLFHSGIACLASSFANVKVIVSHAHTTSDMCNGYIRKIYQFIMRLLITTLSTDLIACSKEAGGFLFGESSLKSRKYQYIPNYIEYPKFLTPSKEDVIHFKESYALANSIVLGHVGRFVEAKNHHFLIELMTLMKKKELNVKLLLVGDGPLKKEIEKLVIKRQLVGFVVFLGSRNDIPTILNSIDLFVFPSVYEGLGLVLLEAQASGIPCVTSDNIQPEADLKIGLVNKLSLKDGYNDWVEQIIKSSCTTIKTRSEIESAFEREGYTLTKILKNLMDIYNL